MAVVDKCHIGGVVMEQKLVPFKIALEFKEAEYQQDNDFDDWYENYF